MRFLTLLFAFTLIVALPRSVSAQTNDAAAAEALFEAGREAMARGDLAAACKNFEDSQKLEPAIGTLFNLANCEEQRGRLASAWQRFTEVAQELPDTDDRRVIALERADALKGRLPYLTLRFAAGVPPDARVSRDGIEIGAAGVGVALPMDPGAHEVVVRAPGYADRAFQVTLALSERKELVIAPGAALLSAKPDATTETKSTEVEPPRGSPVLGYILGGVGLVGLTVGTVTGVMALDAKATMREDGCTSNGHTCRTTEGTDAAASGEILATTSTVAFIVGGVSLGAGAYLILSSGGDSKSARLGRPPTVRGFGVRGAF